MVHRFTATQDEDSHAEQQEAVITKIDRKDYLALCQRAEASGLTMHQYLHQIITGSLKQAKKNEFM